MGIFLKNKSPFFLMKNSFYILKKYDKNLTRTWISGVQRNFDTFHPLAWFFYQLSDFLVVEFILPFDYEITHIRSI